MTALILSMHQFVILNELGSGSYSKVFKARRVSDQALYAIKKVQLNGLEEKEKANALNQVRLLASLDHPNIIAFRDAFISESESALCIVMELAQEGDLARIKQAKRKQQKQDEEIIWSVAKDILLALNYLHQRSIVHRDIKPANIFLSGGGYKLADLNVSKLLKLRQAYTQIGTPYYASPQVWKELPYDGKSDVWSLGVVLYELAALQPPFNGKNIQQLFKSVVKGDYPKLSKAYSGKISQLIKRCLIVEAKGRANCEQLLNSFFPDVHLQKGSQINMIGTIHVPKNIKILKQKLPKSRYEERSSKSEPKPITEKLPPIQRSSNIPKQTSYKLKLLNEVNSIPENYQLKRRLPSLQRPDLVGLISQREKIGRTPYNYKRPEWWG